MLNLKKAHYAFAGKPYITKTQSKHCPRTCSLKPLARSRKVPFLFYLKLLFLKSVQLILQNKVHFFFVGGCIVTILNCSMILQLPGVGLLKTSSFFPHTTRRSNSSGADLDFRSAYRFCGHLIWVPKFKKGRKIKIYVLHTNKKLLYATLFSKFDIESEHTNAVTITKIIVPY